MICSRSNDILMSYCLFTTCGEMHKNVILTIDLILYKMKTHENIK